VRLVYGVGIGADAFCGTLKGRSSAMDGDKNRHDKSTWAVGGGLLLGVGVGLFFLQTSALAFVGSMLGGLGLGLVVTSIISTLRNSG
jgi:hypothetical protein